MPAPLLPLSSLVDAILAFRDDMLTTADAASITGFSKSTISEACVSGAIEANYSCSRGRGHRKRWRFTRTALMTYIWNNTSGDKALMRAALKQKAPDLLALLEPAPVEAAPEPEADNIIPMTPAKLKRRADPMAGAIGDLFARANAG